MLCSDGNRIPDDGAFTDPLTKDLHRDKDPSPRTTQVAGFQVSTTGRIWSDRRGEVIDVIEVEYRVPAVKRQKYTCRCGGCIRTARVPERAVERAPTKSASTYSSMH